MRDQGSVTRLLGRLRSRDDRVHNEAAEQLWRRYSSRLLQLASRRLDPAIRRREDADDVIQSVYDSFCRRQRRGDFALDHRDELWAVLRTITLRKVSNVIERSRRLRRDYRREVPQPHETLPEGPLPRELRALAGSEPGPEEVAAVAEQLRWLIESLPRTHAQIVLWKLAGYTNAEIAGPEMLNCTSRTVERKLQLIRCKLEAEMGSRGV